MAKSQHLIAKTMGGAALAAAAAGAYYFGLAEKAGKHRAEAKTWAHKAKLEVLRDMKKLKNFSQPAYNTVVAEVMKRYAGYKQTAPKQLTALEKQIKGQWKNIAKEVKKASAGKKVSGKKNKTSKR